MIRLGLILAAGCIAFLLWPQIDLWASSLFYVDGFYLKDHPLARFIYRATIISTALFGGGLLALLIYESLGGREWVRRKVLAYLLLALAVGPGLIVNELFKNHFGRARPSQIVQFGGDKRFTPVLIPADQCERNCSFSSGHAAAAFYFVALAPLFRGRRRYAVLAAALAWGWIVGLARIVQGGHFLSDVYCSMVVDLLTAGILYYLFFERVRR